MTLDPLIPAKAGTQMAKPGTARGVRRSAPTRRLSLTIWVPAFAGMSGNSNGR